jgi:hypothetical protein
MKSRVSFIVVAVALAAPFSLFSAQGATLRWKNLTKVPDALSYFWGRNDAMGKPVPDTWRPYQREIGSLSDTIILKCQWDIGDGLGRTTYNWFRKKPDGLDQILNQVSADNPIREIGPPLNDCE